MKKKRTKYYLWPVYIWTISLLLLGFYILQVLYTKPLRYRTIDVILFTERMEKLYKKIYTKPYTRLRNYQKIHITGEKKKDDIKLAFARIRINEIIKQRDTLQGIHFSFGDSSKFINLIQTLDILYQERAERYIIDNGEIWFFEDIK